MHAVGGVLHRQLAYGRLEIGADFRHGGVEPRARRTVGLRQHPAALGEDREAFLGGALGGEAEQPGVHPQAQRLGGRQAGGQLVALLVKHP